MNRKIGLLLLSGLMIGPILGSGIILLPPMAYNKLGTGSLWAWIIIMGLGALFAMIFSKLSMIYPGDGGMTIAIEKAFGKRTKLYASLLMISAVSFGPTAVMLTAAEYLNKVPGLTGLAKPLIALVLVLASAILLRRNIQFVSTVSFVLSSAIAIVLVLSAGLVIGSGPIEVAPLGTVNPLELGQVVLLLFWAIIGWEIVGNYSEQVKDIQKTIPRATVLSIVVITATYLMIGLAIQAFPQGVDLSLVEILSPVFGSWSIGVLALLVTGLCLTTYLLIVGALGRLVYALSAEGYLPRVFNTKNQHDIPMNGVLYFTVLHTVVLVSALAGVLDIEAIVGIANGFFLLNAVIGLVASVKVIPSPLFKVAAIVLALSLLWILSFSTWVIYLAFVGVLVLAILLTKRVENKEVLADQKA